jgi:hypothetical protein
LAAFVRSVRRLQGHGKHGKGKKGEQIVHRHWLDNALFHPLMWSMATASWIWAKQLYTTLKRKVLKVHVVWFEVMICSGLRSSTSRQAMEEITAWPGALGYLSLSCEFRPVSFISRPALKGRHSWLPGQIYLLHILFTVFICYIYVFTHTHIVYIYILECQDLHCSGI